MANLFNSMVRGFGGQIGRTAANRMMSSKGYIGLAIRNLILMVLFFIVIFAGLFYWASKVNPNVNSKEVTTTEVKKDTTEYHNGHVVYTGKRGGKYYYSKSGKKIYF
jgi:hypothetical protein